MNLNLKLGVGAVLLFGFLFASLFVLGGNMQNVNTLQPTLTASPMPFVNPIPTLTLHPKPTSTQTPIITSSPLPISTPFPTDIPTPTVMSSPIPSQTPIETLIPTPSPMATPSPTPTATPSPSPSPTATPSPSPSPTATPSPTPTPTPIPTPTTTPTPTPSPSPVFSDNFDSTLDEWSAIAQADPSGGLLTTINTDYNTPSYCLDSKLFSKNGVPNFYDVYTIFPTSYRALYYSEWVKSVNFVNLNLTEGWNTSIAVGGFECGDQAGYASASIVAVTLPNGSYWGILYPIEPFRTWQQVVSNIPVVDGEWIHFVLYFDTGTGNNGNVTLWVENIQGDMVNVVSVFGFNSSLNYQSTGAWAGQYIANVKNTGFTTEFYEDTVEVATVFPISKPSET